MAGGAALGELIGELVADRYRLLEVIGAGGMGAVFLASDDRLPEQRVAVKLLLDDTSVAKTSPGGAASRWRSRATKIHAARFRREAKILARLHHPNIVSIRDTGQLADGRPFIVMEYLEGESLAVRRRRQRLSAAEVIEVIAQTARGLEAARDNGVVHRDLKPHNLYLCKREDEEGVGTVKILDFGISKMLGAATVETDTATLVGTPQYMAPEQARGEHDRVGPRSDVFSLGVIAYELLSGHRPFDGEALHEVIFKIIESVPPALAELRAELPARLSAAIEVAMAKEQDQRFENATAFTRALSGELPIPLSPPPGRPSKPETVVDRPSPRPVAEPEPEPEEAPTRPPGKRRRWLWSLVAIPVAGAIAIVAARAGRAPLVLDSAESSSARAWAISDAGLAALTRGDNRDALVSLAAGYRGGDRRLATRVALRQALARSGSLVISIDTDSDIISADVTADESELVLATKRSIRRYSIEGGMLSELAIANARVVAYDNDDKLIGVLDSQSRLRILDRETAKVIADRAGRHAFYWLANGSYITAVIEDPVTNAVSLVRETVRGKQHWRYNCGIGPPLSAMAVEGKRLIGCSSRLAIIDTDTGERFASLPSIDEVFGVTGGWISPAGLVSIDREARRALVFGLDNRGYLADLTKKRIVKFERDASAQVRWARLDAAGELAIIEAEGAALEVHRLGETGHKLAKIIAGQRGPVTASSIDSRGRVMVGDASGWIHVEHVNTGDAVFTVRAHRDRVLHVDLAPGTLALSTTTRQLRLWRLGDATIARVEGVAGGMLISLDDSGEHLMVNRGGSKRHLRLDGRSATPGRQVPGLRAISEDGKHLIGETAVFETATGVPVLDYSAFGLSGVVVAAGGVAALHDSGSKLTPYVRRAGKLVPLPELAIEFRRDRASSLSRSGEYLAIGRGDVVDVVNLGTGELVKSLRTSGRAPVMFANDDNIIVTNGSRGVVMIWWREGRQVDLGNLGQLAIRDNRIATVRDDSFVVLDSRTGETLAALAGCDRAAHDTGTRVVGIHCRSQRKIVFWDLENSLPIFEVGRRELGDRPVTVRVDRRDRFALVGTQSGAFRVDLSAESRSPAEVDAAIATIQSRE